MADSEPMPSGSFQDTASNLSKAGFNNSEISDYADKRGGQLLSAGFSQNEVNQYMGVTAPDMAGVKSMIQTNLAKQSDDRAEAAGYSKTMPGFPQALDQAIGMQVSPLLQGKEPDDATVSPDMRNHLIDSYNNGTSKNLGDLMFNAVPEAMKATADKTGFMDKISGFLSSTNPKPETEGEPITEAAPDEYLHELSNVLSETNPGAETNPILKAAADKFNALTAQSAQAGMEELKKLETASNWIPDNPNKWVSDATKQKANDYIAQNSNGDFWHDLKIRIEGKSPQALEAVTSSPYGAVFKLIGATPGANQVFTAVNNYGIPAVAKQLGTTPDTVMVLSMLAPIAHEGMKGLKDAGSLKATTYYDTSNAERPSAPPPAAPPATPFEDLTTKTADLAHKTFMDKAPTAQEFVNSAGVALGSKGEVEGSAALRETYKQTGVPPAQVVADAKINPTIAQDLAVGEVPKAYESLKPPLTNPLQDPNSASSRIAKKIQNEQGQQAIEPKPEEQIPDHIMAEAQKVKDEMTASDAETTSYDPNNLYHVQKALGMGNRPQSLITFLVNKGVDKDSVTAELRDALSGKKNIYKRLVKSKGGYGLDELAMQAREAGYFHDRTAEKVGEDRGEDDLMSDHLIDLIEQEAHGNRIYSADVQNALDKLKGPKGDERTIAEHIGATREDDLPAIAKKLYDYRKYYGIEDQGRQLAATHQADAINTPPEQAEAVADTMAKERAQLRQINPRINDEIKPTENAGSSGGSRQDNGALESGGSDARGNVLAEKPSEERLSRGGAAAESGGRGTSAETGTESDAVTGSNADGSSAGQPDRTVGEELSPEHQELESKLGAPEALNASGLGKLEKKLEGIFANKDQKGLPKAKDLTDAQFSALEDYARRVENTKGALSDDSIPFQRPTFYSALERGVDQFKQERGTAKQWEGIINNLSGVKKEEIEVSGIKDWLKEQKGPVTKAEIQEFLRANQLQIKEVTLQEKHTAQDVLNAIQKTDDLEERNQIADRMGVENASIQPTKFSKYQIPGGKNYKELLLTLPTQRTDLTFAQYVKKYYERFPDSDTPTNELKSHYENGVTVPEKGQLTSKTAPSVFRSSHWDEPNVLAHVRTNDRELANGETALHIEELQSDWHQKGRKSGYQSAEVQNAPNFFDYAKSEGLDKYEAAKIWNDQSITNPTFKAWRELKDKETSNSSKVPDAPFKKTWQEFAFRRMLAQTVSEGKDRITWTTGETQNARYDLSKQIREITAKNWAGDKKIGITFVDKDGKRHVGGEFKPEDLADVVGKDLAQKIIEDHKDSYAGKVNTYSGVDLEVGGEGMKGFYDKILPDFVNKYTKKWGGKVEDMEMPVDKEADIMNGEDAETGSIKVHSLKITDEMRKAIEEGQPLFRRGEGSGDTKGLSEIIPGKLYGKEAKATPTAYESSIIDSMQKVVDRLAPQSKLRVYDTLQDEKGGKGYGATFKNMIYAALDSDNPAATMRHETIHALKRMGMLSDDEWGTLEQAAKDNGWIEKHDILSRYEKETPEVQLEESVAEEFGSQRGTNFASLPEAIRPIFQKIHDFFAAIGQNLRQLFGQNTSADEIFSRINSGEVGRRAAGSGGSDEVVNQREKSGEEQILDKINIGGSDKKSEPLSWNKFYTSVIDKLDPIRRVMESMDKNDLAAASENAYKLMRLLPGAYGKAQQFIEHATFDLKTFKNNGKSLNDILSPVKDDLNGFRAYAAARRAVELEARDINSGMPMMAVDEVLNNGEAKFEPVFKELGDYQGKLLKYLKDSGILNDKQIEDMQGVNRAYVPFYRVMDDENFGLGGGKVKNPIKAIKGSNRDIIDPIESIVRNTYSYITLAERNIAAKSFYDLAQKQDHPEDYVKPAERQFKPTTVSDSEMTKFLTENGIADMPEKTLTVFRAMRTPLAKNEIGFFDDGKYKVVQVDPDIAAAFNGTPNAAHGLLFKMLSVPAKMLRYGLVSPEFIFRHLERNALSASVIGDKAMLPFANYYKGLMSYINKDDWYQDWLKSGGKISALSGLTRDNIQDEMAKLTDTGEKTFKNLFNDNSSGGQAGEKSMAVNFLNKTWNLAQSPFDMIHALQQSLENVARIGGYKQAMKGLETSRDNILESGYYSRNIAPDPARIGKDTATWNAITALFNTELQHTDQLVSAVRDRPLPTLAKAFAFITVPSVILWARHQQDKNDKSVGPDNPQSWSEAHPWERDAFWEADIGGYSMRIPKPFFMGFLFSSVPERLLDLASGEDKDFSGLENMMKDLGEQAAPNFMPNAITPLLEGVTNHSFFRDQKLVPDHLMEQLPEYRYSEYTSELTKAIARLVGYVPYVKNTQAASPIVIDNLLRQWTGALGTYTLSAADYSLRKAGVLPDPPLPTSTLADIPFVKAFVVRYPSATAESVQKFQDDYHQKAEVYNTFKALMQQGDPNAALKVMQSNPTAMAKMDSIDKAIAQQNQLIRLIYKNPGIDPDQKRQLIDATYYNMINMARAGNDAMKSLDQSMKLKSGSQ